MNWLNFHQLLLIIQTSVSSIGIVIILSGVLLALFKYLSIIMSGELISQGVMVNAIRLDLGRILILGLEFIVAADLIGTTSTPDYYAVGMLAIIVLVRTMLSFSINRELMMINKE